MKSSILALGFSLCLSVGAVAQEAPAAGSTAYQVLRVGDRDLSCEALASEANSLNSQIQTQQAQATTSARRAQNGRNLMGGVTGGLLAGAARYGLARTMIGGAISPYAAQGLVQATDSASIAAGNALASSGSAATDPHTQSEQQRLEHLNSLFKEKAC